MLPPGARPGRPRLLFETARGRVEKAEPPAGARPSRDRARQGLSTSRWVVERTISWLHQYRRLRVRCERCVDIHEAFLTLDCALACCKFALRVS
ncbi:MAG: transposase [Candidatus Eisenbacteria bacterium]|nr:transposase [Candidatus Eisenbacteria bacterium]